MKHIIVLGTSEPQDFSIRDDGEPIVGTGLDVAIEFRETDLSAAQLDAVSGVTVQWLDQAGGTVRVSGLDGLPLGTYHVRFTLTDSGGKVGYAPNEAAADEWRVVRV